MHQIIFHPEAEKEFADSALWYESQQARLGERFLFSIESTIELINQKPELFRKVKKDYREASVPVFPFTIIYKLNKKAKVIYIVAVYHAARNPKKKFRRK